MDLVGIEPFFFLSSAFELREHATLKHSERKLFLYIAYDYIYAIFLISEIIRYVRCHGH